MNERVPHIARITVDPTVCHGKPCIRGLRYPVENVLEWLASGMGLNAVQGKDARGSDISNMEQGELSVNRPASQFTLPRATSIINLAAK